MLINSPKEYSILIDALEEARYFYGKEIRRLTGLFPDTVREYSEKCSVIDRFLRDLKDNSFSKIDGEVHLKLSI